MIHLLNGEAAGVKLRVYRQPVLLRVTIDSFGEVDALDRLDDTPSITERVIVYRQVAPGEYVEHSIQPPDVTLRDNRAWQAWASYAAIQLQRETVSNG